jgi:hypothetical protein
LLICHGVVACLGFGRRDVADGLQQPAIVANLVAVGNIRFFLTFGVLQNPLTDFAMRRSF